MHARRRVDYDSLAPTYNRRFQADTLPNVALCLVDLVRLHNAGRVLEAGCGTGRWLVDLRGVADQVYGLDPSAGMLAQARMRGDRLHLTRGRGETLPFPDESLDLVYCVNAIHHMTGQRTFVREARRVLKPGGVLAVIGMDPHGRRDRWYVYPYFEGTYETDMARFPAWETVLDWMVEVGFEGVERRLVKQISDHKTGRAVLADPFLQKHATSQLALLSEAAYAAGLQKIEAAIEAAEATGEEIVFPVDITVEALVGRTPL